MFLSILELRRWRLRAFSPAQNLRTAKLYSAKGPLKGECLCIIRCSIRFQLSSHHHNSSFELRWRNSPSSSSKSYWRRGFLSSSIVFQLPYSYWILSNYIWFGFRSRWWSYFYSTRQRGKRQKIPFFQAVYSSCYGNRTTPKWATGSTYADRIRRDPAQRVRPPLFNCHPPLFRLSPHYLTDSLRCLQGFCGSFSWIFLCSGG